MLFLHQKLRFWDANLATDEVQEENQNHVLARMKSDSGINKTELLDCQNCQWRNYQI